MEAWTSAKVTHHALRAVKGSNRQYWIDQNRFESLGRGKYRFYGWESEIDTLKAMERGWIRGRA